MGHAQSQPPQDYSSLCLSGADALELDGTYVYLTTILKPHGLVWRNSERDEYLYPWDFGDENISWRVGSSYHAPDAFLSYHEES